MIKLSAVFHRHDFKPTEYTFALLPKMNIPAQKGIEGKIEQCSGCDAKRWLHPKLRTVEVVHESTIR